MYNSPIMIIESTIDSFAKSIIKQKDDAIFAEIQTSFGVDLDRDELIRALQYDRNQYEKGYADGKRDAQPKWIHVTERLPAEGGRFLVCGSRGGIYTAEFRMYGHFGEYHHWHKLNSKSHYCEPTHWMPLPEAPKEVE